MAQTTTARDPAAKMADDRIAEVKLVLRAHGLRVTTPRLAVLDVLRHDGGHRSVEQIRDAVHERYPAVDPVTIYRTLETFEAHHLADRVTAPGDVTRWEWSARVHHHVICRRCGVSVEVGPEPFERLADELQRAYGTHVDVRHLTLHGLCRICAAAVTEDRDGAP